MKVYKRRPMAGLRVPGDPAWAQLGDPEGLPLHAILEMIRADRLFLCGSLEQMSREYVERPLEYGWKFARDYVHKYRAPVYEYIGSHYPRDVGRQVAVKLIGHREGGWFPGCEDSLVAIPAWRALSDEWRSTGLPLLSSPAQTGKALLWENLPKGEQFPALSDDLAKHIRRISPQHRSEIVVSDDTDVRQDSTLYQYDGRWMYASLATLDRLPIGEPKETKVFEMFAPGWYKVRASVPKDWHHIGLLPWPVEDGGWSYPAFPLTEFTTWASEPELTLAQQNGWRFKILEGWRFDQGAPLRAWAKKLIAMREHLLQFGDADSARPERHAAAAIRQILNHTIGSFHADGYERESFVSDSEWKEWKREYIERTGQHPNLGDDATPGRVVRVEGGYRAPRWEPDTSRLSIYMPHWSAQIWALERARVTQYALRCDPKTLVKINGDALYLTAPAPWDGEDTGKVGQLRRKQ